MTATRHSRHWQGVCSLTDSAGIILVDARVQTTKPATPGGATDGLAAMPARLHGLSIAAALERGATRFQVTII